jgi:hypothetical protein
MSRFAETADALAGIRIFSGRPDPTWSLASDRLDAIRAIWQELKPCNAIAARDPHLGYSGCFAIAGTNRWDSEGDIVIMTSANREDTRVDPQRRIERAILSSAPTALRAELPDVFDER